LARPPQPWPRDSRLEGLFSDLLVGIESLPPQSFREKRDLWAASVSFVFSERSTNERLDAEQLENVWRYAGRDHAYRAIFALHHATSSE
jgi:hypothetical protein